MPATGEQDVSRLKIFAFLALKAIIYIMVNSSKNFHPVWCVSERLTDTWQEEYSP